MLKTILVVDDSRSICHALSRFLGQCGYRVDVTGDLDEAQTLITAGVYDAVITDLRLSGTNGQEGLDLITAAHDARGNTRCILLSAYLNETVVDAALARGAVAVLRKPVPLLTLLDSLDPAGRSDAE